MKTSTRHMVHGTLALVFALVPGLARAGGACCAQGGKVTATPASAEAGASHAEAMGGHAHAKSALHGGQVSMTEAHHFETVFAEDGIHVYIYTMEQAPMMVESAKGVASLRLEDGSKLDVPLATRAATKADGIVYFCPMHPAVVQMQPGECSLCGGMKLYEQDHLHAKADLSKYAPGKMKVLVEVQGLGKPEPNARFVATFDGIRATAAKESGKDGGHEGHAH